jgi:hypothetical protein
MVPLTGGDFDKADAGLDKTAGQEALPAEIVGRLLADAIQGAGGGQRSRLLKKVVFRVLNGRYPSGREWIKKDLCRSSEGGRRG